MAKFTHDTEDWELHACLDWKEKYHKEDCSRCGGTGQKGRMFCDYSDDRQCEDCCGRGWNSVRPKTPRPELPQPLLEHLRRAWWDYHNPKD